MMIPIIFLFLWTSASGFALQDNTHLSVQAANTGGTKKLIGYFDDQGDGATKQQMITFQNAINSASSFYRDDNEKRLKYIADQMNKAFPQGDKFFQIHQNGLKMAQYQLFVDVDETFSYAPAGSDKIFPNKTYLYNRISTTGKTPFYIPINGSKGSGITPQIESKLKSIIAAADVLDQCDCGYVIWDLYIPLWSWSFICYPEPTEAMCYAYVVGQQYYSTKGKNCYFALWKGE